MEPINHTYPTCVRSQSRPGLRLSSSVSCLSSDPPRKYRDSKVNGKSSEEGTPWSYCMRGWVVLETVWAELKWTPWPESEKEPYRPSDRRLSVKLVSTLRDGLDAKTKKGKASDPARHRTRFRGLVTNLVALNLHFRESRWLEHRASRCWACSHIEGSRIELRNRCKQH
jgi:hypothetical protein